MTNRSQAISAHEQEQHTHDHHSHGPDCDCGCHGHKHSEAEGIVDSAFRFSRRSDVSLEIPIAALEVEAAVSGFLMEAAKKIAVDGVVPGHIKAMVEFDECAVSLSITRIGVVDKTYIGSWAAEELIPRYSLTVNILSVANPDADLGDIIHKLF